MVRGMRKALGRVRRVAVDLRPWLAGQAKLEAWILGFRIRAAVARLFGRAVVLDGDYYRNLVEDFHENLLKSETIRSQALIVQVPKDLCLKSMYGYRAISEVNWRDFGQLCDLRWDGIHLLAAFRTLLCGDAGTIDFLNSPIVDRNALCHHFSEGIALYEVHRRLVSQVKPNAMLVFQGAYGVSRMFHELRRKMNVRTVAIENAFLGDRIYLDGNSGYILNRFSMAKRGREYREMRPEDPCAGEKAYGMWRDVLHRKVADHRTEGISTPEAFADRFGFSLDCPFALLLGQVQVDASILLDSPLYPNSVDFILDAIAACRALKIPLVVRFHPREARVPEGSRAPTNPSYRQVLERLGGEIPPGICLVPGNDVETFLLVRHAVLGLTLNSQSGLEMALHGKPVLTAAECLYARKGFTWDVAHPAGLQATIADAWQHGCEASFDARIRQKAGQFVLDMTRACMPSREVAGSEEIILRQFGVFRPAPAKAAETQLGRQLTKQHV